MDIVVVLDNIRSLHNVGSIFRTADAAGISMIYLSGITPAPLDRFGNFRPQMTKVALGAEKTVPWKKAAETLKLVKRLKNAGYEIISAEQDKRAVPYAKFIPKNKKVALVVGPEVNGITKNILDESDIILEIPMSGRKESLNVSVAFGIIVFHLIQKF